jgi:hypothetical protein
MPTLVSGVTVVNDEMWADEAGFHVERDNVIVIDSIEDIDDASLALRRGLADDAIRGIMSARIPVAVWLPWDAVNQLLPVLRAADSAHRPFRYEINPATLPDNQLDLR